MSDPLSKANRVPEPDWFLPDVYEKAPSRPPVAYSLGSRLLRGLKQNRLACLCVCFLLVLTLASLFAFLAPQDPNKTNMMEKFAQPSSAHWFGTDHLGRDYFTRCLYGGRVSMAVGVFSMLLSILIGTLYGTVSGFAGGRVDTCMMRILDILMSIPSMLLILILNSMIPAGVFTLVFTIGIFSWMGVARIVRAETLSVKERDYVTAARNLGAGRVRILFTHIIPNILSPVLVASSLNIARAILMESSLSYLGFGVQVPQASWGSMLQNAQAYIMTRPLLAVYPGLLILLTVLSFNYLGDGLRSILEPRLMK